MAVGLIVDAAQAEAIVADGQADLVALAREAQDDPNFAVHASRELTGGSYDVYPVQAGPAAGLPRPAARPARPVDRPGPGSGGSSPRSEAAPALSGGMAPRRLLVGALRGPARRRR